MRDRERGRKSGGPDNLASMEEHGVKNLISKTFIGLRPAVVNEHDDQKIKINVGGTLFVTMHSTLMKYPATKLGRLTENDASFDRETGEHFFDRNEQLFSYILNFYRTGDLHFPHDLCGPLVKSELDYWRIGEDNIASCCWNRYKAFELEEENFKELEAAYTNHGELDMDHSHSHSIKSKIFTFLEYPNSSKPALVRQLLVTL